MKRRIWPDLVLVIAVLAIGAGGAWALWRDELRGRGTARRAPEATSGVPTT